MSKDIPLITIEGRTYGVTKTLDSNGSPIEEAVTAYHAGDNILFFVPGKKEIEDQIEKLRERLGSDAAIFPLHAEMPKEEQDALLQKDKEGQPRIIVATNVAEESITIDYIDLVIDLATHKVSRYDERGVQGLYLENTPKSSVKQRSGRVGRTHPGVYNRYNDAPYEDISEYPDAAIEREMLDREVLMFLAQGMDIFSLEQECDKKGERLFFHEFDRHLLGIAIIRLKSIGALTTKGELTELGYTLLAYPLGVYHARMLHEAIGRGCLADVIVMVAILEKKGFLSKEDTWKELGITKAKESDLIGYVSIFRFLTGTTITEKQKAKLIELGVDPLEVDDFMTRTVKRKLYEIVDLSMLGIKKGRLKSVEESHKQVTHKLKQLGIPLTSGKNQRDILTSLATGHIFHTYTYDGDQRGFTPTHARGEDVPLFRIGDISLIVPESGDTYIGSPFIVGSPKDESSGLRLLSFVSHVDEGILKEAQLSNTAYAKHIYKKEEIDGKIEISSVKGGKQITEAAPSVMPSGSHSEVADIPHRVVSQSSAHPEDDGDGYFSTMEKYQDIEFTSDAAAKDYYIRYCLPLFLLQENLGIKKYIKGKSEEWVSIFRELLSRLLSEELHRVKLANMEQTERSFRYDSSILQRFEESNDPHIRYFRTHGRLPELETQKDKKEMNVAELHDTELFEAKVEYARLLGESAQYRAYVDMDVIQKGILTQFLHELGEGNHSGEPIEAYSDLLEGYKKLGDIDRLTITSIGKSLKQIGNQQKKLQAARHLAQRLSKLIDPLVIVSDGRRKYKTVEKYRESLLVELSYFLPAHLFARLEKLFVRVFSSDQKKRKRGCGELKYITELIRSQHTKQLSEISLLEACISLENLSEIKKIQEAILVLIHVLFEEEYGQLILHPKVLDTLRAIVRDQLDTHRGVDAILLDLFSQRGASPHIRGQQSQIRAIMGYVDSNDLVDAHKESVAPEVVRSEDKEYVLDMLARLRVARDELQVQYGSLMNNPLYISFMAKSAHP